MSRKRGIKRYSNKKLSRKELNRKKSIRRRKKHKNTRRKKHSYRKMRGGSDVNPAAVAAGASFLLQRSERERNLRHTSAKGHYITLLNSLKEGQKNKLTLMVLAHYISDAERLFDALFDDLPPVPVDLSKDFMGVLRAIFNSIVIHHYPVNVEGNPLYGQMYGSYFRDIPRSNHGGLNYMRSVLFCSNVMFHCKSKNPELYRTLFPTVAHENLAMINSMFHALMRVGEQTAGDRYSLSRDMLGVIFPELCARTKLLDLIKGSVQSVQQHSSSILFVALMKNILDPRYHVYIEFLALAHAFYIDGSKFYKGLKASQPGAHLRSELMVFGDAELASAVEGADVTEEQIQIAKLNQAVHGGDAYKKTVIDLIVSKNAAEPYYGVTGDFNDENDKKMYFYIVFGQIGHYLDHCRCDASEMIDMNHFALFFDEFNISPEEKLAIQEYVIATLISTEFTGEDYPDEENMKKRCSGLQGRYDNPNFLTFQTNFEECVGGIGLEESILLVNSLE